MNRLGHLSAKALILISCVSGCGTVLPNLAELASRSQDLIDPVSTAPDLAGQWCLQDQWGFVFAAVELNENGDPIRYDEAVTAGMFGTFLGELSVPIDGQIHGSARGYDYVAIGWSSREEDAMEIVIQMRLFVFGIEVGDLQMVFGGHLTTADTVEGVGGFTLNALISDDSLPPDRSEPIRGTRGECPLGEEGDGAGSSDIKNLLPPTESFEEQMERRAPR